MSYGVSVFIRGIGVDDVCRVFRDRLGVNLKSEEALGQRLFITNVFAIDISLSASDGYEDDNGIEFSKYPVNETFKRFAGRVERGGEALCRSMARVFGDIVRVAGADVIVVEEMAALLSLDTNEEGVRLD